MDQYKFIFAIHSRRHGTTNFGVSMNPGPSMAIQSNVLAVNRLFVAVHVVSARRAFCLLWKRLAEVIHIENESYMSYDFDSWREISELKTILDERGELEDWIAAINFDIEVPRVIRLLNYDRIPRFSVKFNRRNVFLRDENRCQYCGKRFSSHNLSLDHVVPRCRGGTSTWDNVVCACLKCNVHKGGRTPQEAGMKLYNLPRRPHRNPLLSNQLHTKKYSCWRRFLP